MYGPGDKSPISSTSEFMVFGKCGEARLVWLPMDLHVPLSSKPENLSQKRKELALNLKLETRMCMVPLNSI